MELAAALGTALAAPPLPMKMLEINKKPLALEIFDRLDQLPHSYFVHLANDNRNAPLIRNGEIVIVDQGGAQMGGWYPIDGGLFVIEYRSKLTDYPGQRYPRVSREIVQTCRDRRGRWLTGSLRRGLATDGVFYCSDGPYPDEQMLADKLIGKVIGIFRSDGQ